MPHERQGGNMRVDGARLWDSLMAMAQIGGTPKGGCNRLTLTDLDREGRALFAAWCDAAGCTLRVDEMGNMFARRAGEDDSLPPVAMGSHLDTQPTGGKFDGVLGVLGALEVVRTLNDMNIRTKHPIEVINWTNEEGSRFAPAMLSSGVFAGVYDLAFAYSRTDKDGLRLGDELARIGYKGPDKVGDRRLHAYFELHIEQGPILEAEGVEVGIVTHAQGLRWYDVTLTGFESHAGTTPMGRRKDALVGAADLILKVQELAQAFAPNAVTTVGSIEAHPNSRNVIPGAVTVAVDLRHPDATDLAALDAAFHHLVADTAAAHGLTAETAPVFVYAPVAFDRTCVDAVRRAAQHFGYSHRNIVSGAGHDACYVAQVAPTAMIFTPCVDGISHNETETITPDWASAGANVLLRAVLETAVPVG